MQIKCGGRTNNPHINIHDLAGLDEGETGINFQKKIEAHHT